MPSQGSADLIWGPEGELVLDELSPRVAGNVHCPRTDCSHSETGISGRERGSKKQPLATGGKDK